MGLSGLTLHCNGTLDGSSGSLRFQATISSVGAVVPDVLLNSTLGLPMRTATLRTGHELYFDTFWQGSILLPSWAGFQARDGAYGSISSDEPATGSVRLVLSPEGGSGTVPTAAEERGVAWLLEHEPRVATACLEHLLGAYPRWRDEYGYSEEELTEYMPSVDTVEDFRDLIGLHTVHVHAIEKNGLPYFGFEFGCLWDEEHGLGVLFNGTRIVESGGADTSFLLWIAEQDAEQT